MSLDRRDFLKWGGLVALAAGGSAGGTTACARPAPPGGKADYTLRIGTGAVELAPDHVVSTLTYNGQFPGPLLRFKEGRRTSVDVFNDTGSPEQLHWHGQQVGVDVDGAAEEGTPYIPAHGMRRISFVPGPAGFRFYHTHVVPRADLSRGQYSGLVGPVYIEPRQNAGAYDQEIFLTLKEFEPTLSRGGDMASDFLAGGQDQDLKAKGESSMAASLARGEPRGYEVGYGAFAVNGRMLGHGDPDPRAYRPAGVAARAERQRHRDPQFGAARAHLRRVALDGNPVPNPAPVPVLWLGAAERISALVTDQSGRLGVGRSLRRRPRPRHGRGRRIRRPRWGSAMGGPRRSSGTTGCSPRPTRPAPPPDHTIEMLIEKRNAADDGFNAWTINGTPFSMDGNQPVLDVQRGKRYRLRFRNASDDLHPMHLHRHTFEITHFAGTPTAGVRKDVAMLGGYQSMDVDFVADQPGLSLLHCHQQIHMDYGLMLLLNSG